MINSVVLVGRMTRSVDLRYTSSNQAVATFTLAVTRNFKNRNGERETDFINVVVWGQQAERISSWGRKGALIGITGRIQIRSYEKQPGGQRMDVTEIIADQFQMLESRSIREGRDHYSSELSNQQSIGKTSDLETGKSLDHDEGLIDSSKLIDISDDDLPF